VGGIAPAHVEYGQGQGLAGLVADQASAPGPEATDDEDPATPERVREVAHSPQDQPAKNRRQEEQQQQTRDVSSRRCAPRSTTRVPTVVERAKRDETHAEGDSSC
jgi:hypothetical protein